jgi:hypothetical protein
VVLPTPPFPEVMLTVFVFIAFVEAAMLLPLILLCNFSNFKN